MASTPWDAPAFVKGAEGVEGGKPAHKSYPEMPGVGDAPPPPEAAPPHVRAQAMPVAGPGGLPVYCAAEIPDDGGCTCTMGWVCFGLGFGIFIAWIVAMCIPCCDKGSPPKVRRNNRSAASASGVLFFIYLVTIITLIALSATGAVSSSAYSGCNCPYMARSCVCN